MDQPHYSSLLETLAMVPDPVMPPVCQTTQTPSRADGRRGSALSR